MYLNVKIYSCVTNAYDKVVEKAIICDSIKEWVLYTDDFRIEADGWNRIKLNHPEELKDLKSVDRWYKFFPHKFLKDVDISIYIDGNIEILKNLKPLIDKFYKSGFLIGCFKHPQRDNILEEIQACYSLNKIDLHDGFSIQQQLSSYHKDGFDLRSKLFSGGVIFRRHTQIAKLDSSMNLWWNQLCTYTKRDQLSLPYVLWRANLGVYIFDMNIFDNEYLVVHRHKPRLHLPTSLERTIRKLKHSMRINKLTQ
jgi:hypothetical protein